MQTCIRCFVSGQVQGVSFRYYTRQQATRLNLKGWAKNLADGRVDVLACGEQQAVDTLHSWLNKGPSLAYVTDVECQPAEASICPDSFEIG